MHKHILYEDIHTVLYRARACCCASICESGPPVVLVIYTSQFGLFGVDFAAVSILPSKDWILKYSEDSMEKIKKQAVCVCVCL